jgi:hypothetical protein
MRVITFSLQGDFDRSKNCSPVALCWAMWWSRCYSHYFTIYSESFICTERHAERMKDVSLETRLIVSSSDLSIQWPLTMIPEGNSTALILLVDLGVATQGWPYS